MPDLWDVDYWVEEAALLPIAKFYPSAVTAGTEVPVQDVFHKLLTFVEENRLFIRWQIRCQSYDCVRTIAEVDDVQEPVGSVVRCLCGEEYEISSDMLFPVFGFEQDFRDKVRARVKKNINFHAQKRCFE